MKATFTGKLVVRAPIERAFPLFSPPGELHWVPGWNPEFVEPPVSSWEEGQVFRTQEERGEAIWVGETLSPRDVAIEPTPITELHARPLRRRYTGTTADRSRGCRC